MAPAAAIARHGFDTTDPDVANDALGRMYGDVRSWVFGDPDGFTYALRAAATPKLATAHMRFTMGFGIDAQLAPHHHTILAMLGGDHYSVATRYGQVTLRPGDIAVVPADAALEVSLHALDVITLSLSTTEVARTAEEVHGVGGLDLLGMQPVSARHNRYYRRLVGLASSELIAGDTALDEPLIYHDTLRSLCTGFLHTFPTTASTAVGTRAGRVAPRALRRAVAYIDAHAAEPITLTDIAHAAGTSPRALQHAFTRHQATTPMAYLRYVRLQRAHDDLLAADPTTGATVAAIAQRWGYTKPGHFAAAYRQAHGINPHHTLHT